MSALLFCREHKSSVCAFPKAKQRDLTNPSFVIQHRKLKVTGHNPMSGFDYLIGTKES